jgi:uncharacterized protein
LPATVESSEEFSVDAPQDSCWAFFSDLTNIGSCIPGCESVTNLAKDSAIFKVKVKVGYISRTFQLKAKLVETNAPSHLSFCAQGSDAEVTGKLSIERRETDRVSIKYSVEIRPISVTGKTAVAMMGKELVRKQASEFATCVKARLERVVPPK